LLGFYRLSISFALLKQINVLPILAHLALHFALLLQSLILVVLLPVKFVSFGVFLAEAFQIIVAVPSD
jgi:hypothetical protein